MNQAKDSFSSKLVFNFLSLVLSIMWSFFILIKQSYAFSHDWAGVPINEYGEQLWDRKSIKRNEDGSISCLLYTSPSPRDS